MAISFKTSAGLFGKTAVFSGKTAVAAASVLLCVSAISSCTKDVTVPDGGLTPSGSGNVTGFYLLNEGGYGYNNSTLDYVDITTGTYHTNYFSSQNPGMPLELGDVGNDIFISGGLMFIILNGSGIVEIASADDARHIAEVEVPNCRYGTVADGCLYVTSFAGNGLLYRISLEDYKVTGTLQTGYEPEQLLYLDGFLYVLNSGGYHSLDGYDDRITVVDVSDFTVDRTVSTGHKNLYKIMYADSNVYITSRGDYGDDPGAVFTYDPASDKISLVTAQPVSNWCRYGNTVYTQTTVYDEQWNTTDVFGKITDGKFSTASFLDLSGISLKSCYGLDVNPETGDFVVTDAGDHTAEGSVHYFNSDGSLRWSHTAGVSPSKVCWIYEKDME